MDLSYDEETGLFWWTAPGSNRNMNKPAGSVHKEGYVAIQTKGKRWQAHRLAWRIYYGVWPTMEIDHINGDRSDNRIVNLREVTSKENSANSACHRDKAEKLPRCIDRLYSGYRVRATINGMRTYKQGIKDLETAMLYLERLYANSR